MEERIRALAQAVELEKEVELEAYKSLLENKSIKERVEEGVTLYPVNYVDHHYDKFENLIVQLKYNHEQSARLFSQNGQVSLFSTITGEAEDALVVQNKDDEIHLKLRAEVPGWIKKGKLGINAVCDTNTFDIQLKALKKIARGQVPLAPKFYYYEQKEAVEEIIAFSSLNDSQNVAASALMSDQPFHIIHGPPGTGKTSTLVRGIAEYVASGKKVLVATSSNAAVDHITYQLASNGVDAIRVGNSFKINENVFEQTLSQCILRHPEMSIVDRLKKDAEVIRKRAFRHVRSYGKEEFLERKELKEELKEITKDIRSIESKIRHHCLESADVISGTFAGIKQAISKNYKFDLIVVDEAGQSTEPLIWSISNYADRLIMAGDPFQLPPTLFSDEAVKLGLAKSLIEVGIEKGIPTTLLNVQYRMNDKIMQFSNSKFYKGKLTSDNSVQNIHLENEPFEPIEFIDTAGCSFDEEKDEGGGISNPGEADIVAKRLAEINKNKYSIAIIAPYRKQVSLLKDKIPDLYKNIQTVDSFQGQEREVIIISLTRSNSMGVIGFLRDYRRMNVAMTRAKRKLIIIGDSATVGNDRFYSDMLAYVEGNGTYRSAWEFQ